MKPMLLLSQPARLLATFLILVASTAAFAQNGKVYGSARTPDYSPLVDITIELHDAADHSLVTKQNTDKNGVFNLVNVPAGLYFISAIRGATEIRRTPNFEVHPGESNYQPLTIDVPAAPKPEDEKPKPAPASESHSALATITGTIRDLDYNALSGYKVTLLRADTRESVVSDTTGVSGKFEFTLIEPARYYLVLEKNGSEVKRTEPFTAQAGVTTPENFDIDTRPKATPQNLPTNGMAKVVGTIRNTDFAPLAGYSVTLREKSSAAVLGPLVTSEDGKYSFGLVPPGTYTLSVSKDDATIYTSESFDVQVGDTFLQNADIDTNVPSDVVGTVHRPDDKPWNAVRVELRNDMAAFDSPPVATTTTSADGKFTFKAVASGKYLVRVIHEGRLLKETSTFEVKSLVPVSLKIVADEPTTGRVVATVVSQKGAPIANAVVMLMLPSGEDVTAGVTDTNGHVLLSTIKPGLYVLAAQAQEQGYSGAQSNSFTIEAGKDHAIKLTLPLLK